MSLVRIGLVVVWRIVGVSRLGGWDGRRFTTTGQVERIRESSWRGVAQCTLLIRIVARPRLLLDSDYRLVSFLVVVVTTYKITGT